jgi:hypothetical protein
MTQHRPQKLYAPRSAGFGEPLSRPSYTLLPSHSAAPGSSAGHSGGRAASSSSGERLNRLKLGESSTEPTIHIYSIAVCCHATRTLRTVLLAAPRGARQEDHLGRPESKPAPRLPPRAWLASWHVCTIKWDLRWFAERGKIDLWPFPRVPPTSL